MCKILWQETYIAQRGNWVCAVTAEVQNIESWQAGQSWTGKGHCPSTDNSFWHGDLDKLLKVREMDTWECIQEDINNWLPCQQRQSLGNDSKKVYFKILSMNHSRKSLAIWENTHTNIHSLHYWRKGASISERVN